MHSLIMERSKRTNRPLKVKQGFSVLPSTMRLLKLLARKHATSVSGAVDVLASLHQKAVK